MIERDLDWSSRPNPRNAEEGEQRQREIEENRRNEAAALRALLGDAKATQWNEYLASQPSRSKCVSCATPCRRAANHYATIRSNRWSARSTPGEHSS